MQRLRCVCVHFLRSCLSLFASVIRASLTSSPLAVQLITLLQRYVPNFSFTVYCAGLAAPALGDTPAMEDDSLTLALRLVLAKARTEELPRDARLIGSVFTDAEQLLITAAAAGAVAPMPALPYVPDQERIVIEYPTPLVISFISQHAVLSYETAYLDTVGITVKGRVVDPLVDPPLQLLEPFAKPPGDLRGLLRGVKVVIKGTFDNMDLYAHPFSSYSSLLCLISTLLTPLSSSPLQARYQEPLISLRRGCGEELRWHRPPGSRKHPALCELRSF